MKYGTILSSRGKHIIAMYIRPLPTIPESKGEAFAAIVLKGKTSFGWKPGIIAYGISTYWNTLDE